MSNQQAMTQLPWLWQEWINDPAKTATRHFGPSQGYLRPPAGHSPLERRGPARTDGSCGEYSAGSPRLRAGRGQFEVELWCRDDEAVRQRAYANLSALIQQAGGRCIAQAAIPEITYHGVLAEMASQSLRATIDGIVSKEYSQLLRCEDIMFFRPFGQSRTAAPEDADVTPPPVPMPASPPAAGDPVVALFDGLPLENHVLLDGRLLIDDPDEHRRITNRAAATWHCDGLAARPRRSLLATAGTYASRLCSAHFRTDYGLPWAHERSHAR